MHIKLNTRNVFNLKTPPGSLDELTSLFATNKEVHQYNIRVMRKVAKREKVPVGLIRCFHNNDPVFFCM